jgi:hypothetical protein
VNEALLRSPRPIDRVAARVVKKAKPEDLWAPDIRKDNRAFSSEFLPTKELPANAIKASPELAKLVGRRRGRMTIIGYAAYQGNMRGPAKWVVRCDCGNYEHRQSIFRWLGTEADDMCWVCDKRSKKIKARGPAREPAKRATKAEA